MSFSRKKMSLLSGWHPLPICKILDPHSVLDSLLHYFLVHLFQLHRHLHESADVSKENERYGKCGVWIGGWIGSGEETCHHRGHRLRLLGKGPVTPTREIKNNTKDAKISHKHQRKVSHSHSFSRFECEIENEKRHRLEWCRGIT